MVLCEGGKFALGLFEGARLVEHRSESKYVQRKKAGQRQMNRDKAGRVMNSVGSQMRRENEKLLQDHIEQILEESMPALKASQAIFLFAPGFNRLALVAEHKPLRPLQDKLILLNFPVKKANFTELLAAAEKLFTLRVDFTL